MESTVAQRVEFPIAAIIFVGDGFSDLIDRRLRLKHKGTWSCNTSYYYEAKMTTALLDRLTHYCHIIKTGKKFFRYKQGPANTKIRIQQREKENIRQKKIWPICSEL